MRKRRANKSSLELFLDTICNVFGGIVLIAILLAIQVRHTEGTIKIPEALSPEKIAEAQQELDQISADIETLRVLFETTSATLPRPVTQAELERAELYYKLSAAKGAAAVKKAELLNQHLAQEKERIDWEDSTRIVKTQLQQANNERQRLAEEVGKLNRQIAANQRNENVYMPRLREAAANKKPKNFVLHGNRLYVWDNRNHFDHVLNESDGSRTKIPKKTAGVIVEDTQRSKQQIFNLLDKNFNQQEYPSIRVYEDSADQWYIIREMLVNAGVEYELIPTPKNHYTRIPPPGGGQPPGATPPHPGAAVSPESTDGSGGGGGAGMGSGESQGTGGGGGIGSGQGGGNRPAVVQ